MVRQMMEEAQKRRHKLMRLAVLSVDLRLKLMAVARQMKASFPCCQNDSILEKTNYTDLNEREVKLAAEKKSNKRRISRRNSGKKGTCTRRVCTMPTWIESWEREDTYAALAVIGAALSVAFAYRCYKELR